MKFLRKIFGQKSANDVSEVDDEVQLKDESYDEAYNIWRANEDEITALYFELIDIGKGIGYLGLADDNPSFDSKNRNIRARQIGARLNDLGGTILMREVWSAIHENREKLQLALGKTRELGRNPNP